MKILFIQPTADKRGHYGIYTVNLCQELSRLNQEVTLFTNKLEPEKFISERPLFKFIEVKNGKYEFERFEDIKKKSPLLYIYKYIKTSFVILNSALEFLKDNHFDIIQITDVEYGTLSFLLRLYKKNLPPIVLLIHAPNFSFFKYPGNFLKRVYKVLQREILKRRLGKEIKAIVTLGEYHKEELKKQLTLPSNFPIKIIYDGANPPSFYLNKQEAKEKIKIDYQGPTFLFFGMLRKEKGLEYLLKAVSLLKNKDFKVLIAGSLFDYKEKDILNLINKLGIENKVILRLKYIEDKKVPFYFYSSDVLVLPYCKIYTGGSGPLLKEAAVFSVPVIVSDVSEMGRLVKKHQMGLLVNPEDPLSLADKMKAFLEMPLQERQRLAENAFSVANTWENMAKEYLQLYKKIYDKKA